MVLDRSVDIHFNCPRCGQKLSVEGGGVGVRVNCPSCNEAIDVPRDTASPPPLPISNATIPRTATRPSSMMEYKVLTQKDRFFGGKFDPEKLEKAINSYAAEGWSVVSVATASIPSMTGTREEMIIVMGREK